MFLTWNIISDYSDWVPYIYIVLVLVRTRRSYKLVAVPEVRQIFYPIKSSWFFIKSPQICDQFTWIIDVIVRNQKAALELSNGLVNITNLETTAQDMESILILPTTLGPMHALKSSNNIVWYRKNIPNQGALDKICYLLVKVKIIFRKKCWLPHIA